MDYGTNACGVQENPPKDIKMVGILRWLFGQEFDSDVKIFKQFAYPMVWLFFLKAEGRPC